MTIDLPPLRPGQPASEALSARRAGVAAPQPAPPAGVQLDTTEVGGVRCVVLAPEGWRGELVYFHGGGYRLGQPGAWVPLASKLALATNTRATVVDYRLAPEHPFPAAVHDAVAVYEAIRASAPASAVFVSGDSAGGGLAAVVAVASAASRVAVPDGVILLSPWLDLTLSGETYRSRAARDLLFPPATSGEAAATYLQGAPAEDPLASPLFADLSGFPPALLLAGSEETLLADSLRFSERLAMAGTSVTLHVAAGMQHVWPLLVPDAPETAHALALVESFTSAVGG